MRSRSTLLTLLAVVCFVAGVVAYTVFDIRFGSGGNSWTTAMAVIAILAAVVTTLRD
ncbi:hypothetical protein [Halorussus halophilus]|uniref:hypothetical protein n=1 Tax=Halorussus halophilus TaxID=2650975 RepID=UPI0017887930|nr:hypothetical protein [Halorussus halophilus]